MASWRAIAGGAALSAACGRGDYEAIRGPVAGTPGGSGGSSSGPRVAEVQFDWSTRVDAAPGSDGWPITWASDDHQYGAWGNGGGFGDPTSRDRVSLGVGRLVGDWPGFEGQNVWGGADAMHPAQFEGKSYGILDVEGTMFMWLRQCCGDDSHAQLTWSSDRGATWTQTDWFLPASQQFSTGTFLQFGRGYDGARDDFVYAYFIRVDDGDFGLVVKNPGRIDLARAPKERLLDRDAYRFFAGFDGGGAPRWVFDPMQREPVVVDDERGIGWCSSATYNADLERYLVTHVSSGWTKHGTNEMAIFEGPEPWGPFSVVEYLPDFPGWTLAFSNKWTRPGGRETVAVFTSGDQLSLVEARLELDD